MSTEWQTAQHLVFVCSSPIYYLKTINVSEK